MTLRVAPGVVAAACDQPGCPEYIGVTFPTNTSRMWFVDRHVLQPAGWQRRRGQVFCRVHS